MCHNDSEVRTIMQTLSHNESIFINKNSVVKRFDALSSQFLIDICEDIVFLGRDRAFSCVSCDHAYKLNRCDHAGVKDEIHDCVFMERFKNGGFDKNARESVTAGFSVSMGEQIGTTVNNGSNFGEKNIGRCNYCGVIGHWARNCFKNPNGTSFRTSNFNNNNFGPKYKDAEYQEFLKFKEDKLKREKAEEQATLIELALRKVLPQQQWQAQPIQHPQVVHTVPTQTVQPLDAVQVLEMVTPSSPSKLKKVPKSEPGKKRPRSIDEDDEDATKKKLKVKENDNIFDTGVEELDVIIGMVCGEEGKIVVSAFIEEVGNDETRLKKLHGAVKLWLGVGFPTSSRLKKNYGDKVYEAALKVINNTEYVCVDFSINKARCLERFFVREINKLYDSRKRRKWEKIEKFFEKRAMNSENLGLRWIDRLWNDNNIKIGINNFMSNKNLIYALVNTKTRRMYVGRTTTTMTKRWQRHRQAINAMEYRNLYKYMRRTGVDNWMIIPLEFCHLEEKWDKGKERRFMDWKEAGWINKYRNWVLNCPNSVRDKELSKEFTKKITARNNRLKVIMNNRRIRKAEIYRILRDEVELDKESNERLMDIMINVRKLTLAKNQKKKIERVVSVILRKRGISLARRQFVCVPNIDEKMKKDVSNYLRERLLAKYGPVIANYIMQKVKVTGGKVKNILQSLGNGNKYNGDNVVCTCSKLKSNNKEDIHICIKVNELGTEHWRLKEILTRNSNTRIEVNKAYWKRCVNKSITDFLRKNGINEEIHDKLNYEQKKCSVKQSEVSWIKKEYKGCIFTEVDKNHNTWAIMCPLEYK